MRYFAFLIALLAVGCHSPEQRSDSRTGECPSEPIAGEPDEFTLAGQTLDGVDVGDLTVCNIGNEDTAGHVPLTGQGHRQLVFASDVGRKIPECDSPPFEPDTCPQIQVDYFARAVYDEMKNEGIEARGYGNGPCVGRPVDTYADSEFSIFLADWKDSDEAARVLAESLNRWEISSDVGIALRPKYCELLERES